MLWKREQGPGLTPNGSRLVLSSEIRHSEGFMDTTSPKRNVENIDRRKILSFILFPFIIYNINAINYLVQYAICSKF